MASQTSSQPRTKAPVSSHPLFPAIVALWFGALFGLGSLAVRASLIEAAVLALHLDVVIPAAAPPIGMTARMILALVMAALGIATGAVIARHIARPKPEAREGRRRTGANFGVAAKAGPAYAVPTEPQADAATSFVRRRPLALDEAAPTDYPYDVAPLPGASLQILDVSQFDQSDRFDAPLVAAEPVEPQVFGHPPENAGSAAAPVATSVVEPIASEAPAEPVNADAPAMESFRPFEVAPVATPAACEETAEPTAPLPVAEAIASMPHMPPMAAPAPQPELASAPLAAALAPAEGVAASRIATAELAELSPVELIERLAMALQKRPHRGPQPEIFSEVVAALAQPAHLPTAPSMPAPEIECALPPFAPASPFAAPQVFAPPETMPEGADGVPGEAATMQMSLPAAMRLIDFSQYEDISEIHPDVPPTRLFTAPATEGAPLTAPVECEVDREHDVLTLGEAEVVQDEPLAAGVDEAEAEVCEDAYSSLLDIAHPAPPRQTFVRIDEPQDPAEEIEPVVIFPGHLARAGTRFARPAPALVAEADASLSAPVPIGETGTPQFRRFDPPSAVVAAPAADSEEIERALRSALATLQRMSGAA